MNYRLANNYDYLLMSPSIAPDGPPLNFSISTSGTTLEFSWQQPAEELRNGLIMFYTLSCLAQGSQVFSLVLNDVLETTLDDFLPNTAYVCSLSASTSGGASPLTSAEATTDGNTSYILCYIL